MPAKAKRVPEAPPETLVISDAATLKAMAEPTRIRILIELADGPKTVKEIADILELGATRLYYHFKILERAGLIRVAARRMVSGIEERTYEATASSWTTAPETNETIVESGVMDAMLEVVAAELELALESQGAAPLGEPSSAVPIVSFTRLALSEEDVADVQRRIDEIMLTYSDFTAVPEGKRLYHALFAGYRAPSELHGRNS
jgi:DNA-binding transcriptional ArsR family regulator